MLEPTIHLRQNLGSRLFINVMRKLFWLLLALPVFVQAQPGQYGTGFKTYVSGSTTAFTDSIRFRGDGVVSVTVNGKEILISAAGVPVGSVDSTSIVNLSVAATDLVNGAVLNAKIANSAVDSNKVKAANITSTDIKDGEVLNADLATGAITVNKFASSVYPAIRGKVGWTSNGTITQDTLTTRIELGGTDNTSFKVFNAGNDTVAILPGGVDSKYVLWLKNGTNRIFAVDSVGYIYSQAHTQVGSGNMIIGDATLTSELQFNSAGNFVYNNWQKKPDYLEFLGGALKETAAAGASDTTQNYIPVKAFSVDDTATFDFGTSKRFASIDSIVVIAYANTATSNVVFNCQIRQIQIGGAIAGAFNASSSKTIATGTATTLRQWSFTSFGSVTANVASDIVGKIYRTTGGTGGDVFVRRVRIYGVGLK